MNCNRCGKPIEYIRGTYARTRKGYHHINCTLIPKDDRIGPGVPEFRKELEDIHAMFETELVLRKRIAELEAELAKCRLKWQTGTERPEIVCLCGSTRFKDVFDFQNYDLTMSGVIVLTVGFFVHSSGNQHGEHIGCTPEQKKNLDELHKRKIDLCDRIFVLNVGGYIGESTRSEIDYAHKHGKPVSYLEPPAEE